MELYINNEKIDFVLEEEKNLHDLLQGIESWLQNSKLHIHSILLNEEALDISDEGVTKSTPIGTIKKLDIAAGTTRDIRMQNVATVYDFFSILKEALLTENREQLEELEGEFGYIQQYLSSEFMEQEIISLAVSGNPHSFFVKLKEVIENWDPGKAEEIVKDIDTYRLFFTERLREIDDPEREADIAARLMLEFLPHIRDVSILLQTGKDREAMNRILKFSELTQKIMRLLPQLHSLSKDVEEVSIGIKDSLQELTEAFTAQDSVLIGDLLEYEISPKIETLMDMIRTNDQPEED